MLQEFLRRGKKKWANKPGSNFREGSSAELGFCSLPVWGSAYAGKSAKRPPWKWWSFWWIFAVDFLVAKCERNFRRKNLPENPPAENKKSAGARPPPEIRQPGPKICRKPYQRSLSCCWWDGQGLLRTLPDKTFSRKRSF